MAGRRIALLALALVAPWPSSAQTLQVGVASSVAGPLRAIAASFGRETGIGVRLSVAASGQLVQQVRHGAPFALLLAADAAYAEAAAALVPGARTATYARGRLVLACGAGASLPPDTGPAAALERLAREPAARLALANPAYAPYGRAARAVLQRLGLLPAPLAGRLVRGTSASHTAQLLAAGAVDCALLPPGLARDAGSGVAVLVPIPAQWHAPIEHRMALLRPDQPAAVRLFRYLRSPAAQARLAAAGLEPAGDTLDLADQPP